ncbi:MAG: hypothetical protein MK137_03775 [Rickettsiales bacterium]|nr:hypothetical protein [Rickettsiales bacterium]
MDIKQFIFSDFSQTERIIPSRARQQEEALKNAETDQSQNESSDDTSETDDNEVTPENTDTVTEAEPEIQQGFSEEEVELAKKLGFQEGHQSGYDEGYKKAMEEISERDAVAQNDIQKALEQLGNGFTDFTTQYWDQQKTMEAHTIMLAHDITKKLTADTSDEETLSKITQLIQRILPTISDEPKISILVHPSMEPIITEHLDAIMSSSPFWGEINLQADSNMTVSDVTIQWQNGSFVYSQTEIKQRIDQLIKHSLNQDVTD